MARLYIGLMSGTSLDGVDAVLVDFTPSAPCLLEQVFVPMPEDLRAQLLRICNSSSIAFADFACVDVEIARLSSKAVMTLLNKTSAQAEDVCAIGSHGQTIFHQPSGNAPTSVQIGDPNLITELTGITTVSDFRRRDIAAHGQGAPLVPAFHQALFRSSCENRVILNIGGIANITALPKSNETSVIGFDTGPGNVLMDYWIGQHEGKRYDMNGDWAASGQVNATLLASMLNDPYFASAPPKSTGRELFNPAWLAHHIKQVEPGVSAPDVQATLSALSAQSIAHAIARWADHPERVIVCGGGAHNAHLIDGIRKASALPVESSARFGIDPNWVEAVAFAWLAKQCIEKKTGNLPSVTGASHPVILGGIYQR